MKVLCKGDFKNIKKDEEFIIIRTEKGQNIQLCFNLNTNKMRLIVDHTILKACDHTEDFQAILEVGGFHND